MPLDRLLLVLFCVVTLAGATLWLVSLIWVSASLHPALVVVPIGIAALVGYIILRVINERLRDTDNDHYDRLDH